MNDILNVHDLSSNGFNVRSAYANWLTEDEAEPRSVRAEAALDTGQRVAIVGAGMAGLYIALLLKRAGVDFKIFESSQTHLGGRVNTYRFNSEDNQYFEAGPMRFPRIGQQKVLFDLIEYLNLHSPDKAIDLVPYVISHENNYVYTNGRRHRSGRPYTRQEVLNEPDVLGFPLQGNDMGKSAQEMLKEVVAPFEEIIRANFDMGFHELMKFDGYSFRGYLREILGWYEEKINYLETLESQTNQFHASFSELIIESLDFSNADWVTIKDGVERLPHACMSLIESDRIVMGATVTRIDREVGNKIDVYHTARNQPEQFDHLVFCVPPSSLTLIERERWSPQKEHAIRAFHFEPLYKIGLRFKERFWEKGNFPSFGGQSITDLPNRWVVYPSYGIGNEEEGVLLLYSWMSDAAKWLAQSPSEQTRLALRDLDELYGHEVSVNDLFLGAKPISWSLENATGDAMFYPGQFKDLYNVGKKREGNIHFAGEHLSPYHTWIAGAIDSALRVCRELLDDTDLEHLKP